MPAFVAPALATTAKTSVAAVGVERRLASASPGQAPALVGRHVQHVDVHHARGRDDRRVGASRTPRHRQPGRRGHGSAAAAWRAAHQRREVARPSRPRRRRRPPPRASRRGRPASAAPGSRPRSRPRRRSSPPRSSRTRPRPGRTARAPSSGAAGTNARDAGWSVEIVAGARTSAQIRSASSPPDPLGRDRSRPARRPSSSAGRGPDPAAAGSRSGSARRRRSPARAPRSRRSYVCMRCITAASSSATR